MHTKSRRMFLASILLLFSTLAVTAPMTKQKMIALTFDDGPNPPYTEQILNILQQNNAKATFFVTGGSVKAYPEMLKKVYAAGNVIGNHTYSHPLTTKLSTAAFEKELNKTNQLIFDQIHVYPVLFRPPYGMSNTKTSQTLERLGYKKITWDYMVNDYESWKTTADEIARNVIQHARPGAIITMHDGGKDRSKTVKALSQIIATLKQAGYKFVTVAALKNIEPYHK